MVLYLYNLAFGDWQDRLGQAAAVGWIFALIIAVFSLVNFLLTRSISSSKTKTTRASKTQRNAVIGRARSAAAESERKAREAGVATILGRPTTSAAGRAADADESKEGVHR